LDRATDYINNGGNPTHYVNGIDSDTDDIPDWLEDDDNDNVPNFLDPDNSYYHDDDNDGLINLYDSDDDGAPSNLPDEDGDGEYDFRDIDNEISLPIELIAFEARKFGNEVLLSWKTAVEINNDFFIVERSMDGRSFEEVLRKSGAGNSLIEMSYSGMDEKPRSGHNYYRLTQVDFNGRSETFDDMIRVVKFQTISSKTVKVYPNPTNGNQLFISLTDPEAGAHQFEIIASVGNVIKRIEVYIPENQRNVEVELLGNTTLAKGAYYLRWINKAETTSFKFIVQ